jgi:hypothetical protein
MKNNQGRRGNLLCRHVSTAPSRPVSCRRRRLSVDHLFDAE